MKFVTLLVLLFAAGAAHAADGSAAQAANGLLFHMSGDKSLTADQAGGVAEPNFAANVKLVPNGAVAGAIEAADDQVLSWLAPGNIYAQRGTLSFYWRARTPVGPTEFPLFRVGYADHASWDMTFLRIDWNGHGFDAFVTDVGLARTRVSMRLDTNPAPDRWLHLAFTWDETEGVRLYVDGKRVATQAAKMLLESGLDQFGPHSRIVSPHQVQSRYAYMRGGDIDEIRIFDHALDDGEVASLATPTPAAIAAAPTRNPNDETVRSAWRLRFGWNGDAPPPLTDAATTIRKVEFVEARDLKQRVSFPIDGIDETTWPGVYNRSRLPGRSDYFILPDWNVYSGGGKLLTLTLPDENFSQIEIRGPAFGRLSWNDKPVAQRPAGQGRTVHRAIGKGGTLRFENEVQETPIQEIGAYDVHAGGEPADRTKLSYTIRSNVAPDYPCLDELTRWIDGRFVADERSTVVALPDGAPSVQRATKRAPAMPVVHVLIPVDFRSTRAGRPLGRFSYGWNEIDGGLDGIAIDLPALNVEATHTGTVPLNLRVADPLWPARALMDVSIAVKPGEARTIWLDTRDRILPNDRSLYLSIASAAPDFDASKLDGAHIRLLFKPRAQAIAEHVHDRFVQARDQMAFLVEEHSNSRRLASYVRLERDLGDLLRVAPDHVQGRFLQSELNPEQGWPPFKQPEPPAGVPLWAFRQVEDLRLVHRYVSWWIDHRQIENGEFGGGLSDDTDLTQQWPPLALMGVEPDKIARSLRTMVDAVYANGMFTDGLGTIQTDELHSYEEGINGISEAMYLDWGDPRAVERLMATARATERLTEVNAAGHRHVISNYFSGTRIAREGPWEWSKPNSYLVFHPSLLLVEFNGQPRAKKLLLELADGYLAHGKQETNGTWRYPAEIHFPSDKERNGTGVGAAMHLFLAAHRWTGDAKYLQPLTGELAKGGQGAFAQVNEDPTSLLTPFDKVGTVDSDFMRHLAWQITGDKRYLEELYGRQIQTASQRMFMVTEAEWWSDRVELFSDELQRARLGGMALRRGQILPGHRVSWRFAAPASGESVALLVRGDGPEAFEVTAFNLDARPVAATMTAWNVPPGRWRMEMTDAAARTVELERGSDVELRFPSRHEVKIRFVRETPDMSQMARPDLGIGAYDVTRDASGLTVRVHSLGSADAPASTLLIEDATGRLLAQAAIPAIPAPLDLEPKTADVRIALTPAQLTAARRVRIKLDGREITLKNNEVRLGM
ncbi:LamG-like jellyroll fold domain-containing protein [Roseiterribacter gracilis]|uniref:LamG-like jellyroll fold domain-containing protein n=1 Tax=Roseiterribacter gracilis TaxID=2812848 RepID=A0A8S8XCW4_9PROT|nr:hypothetical protein TMPK1_12930 [Rhodospirillales bacterium TMPK1]